MAGGMCEWAECQSYETPIVVTCPAEVEGNRRVRFCCYEHLAAWAIKERLKADGVFANTRTHEQAILLHVAVFGRTTGALPEKKDDIKVVSERPPI